MKRYYFSFLLLCASYNIAAVSNDWNSSLYPWNWTPGYALKSGICLQDYSYAGYRNSEYSPNPDQNNNRVFNVMQYGADKSGASNSFSAFFRALSEAQSKGGGIVFVPTGIYKLESPLNITSSNIVIRGEGPGNTRICFENRGQSNGSSAIYFYGTPAYGPDYLLRTDTYPFQRTVQLLSVNGLEAGMDISIGCVITDAFRKDFNMLDYWEFAKGQWRGFFKRKILSVDKKNMTVTFDVPLRYSLKMRDAVSLRPEYGYISECGIENLSISDIYSDNDAWNYKRVHAVTMYHVKDGWMSNIHSFHPSSPHVSSNYHLQSCGLYVLDSKRVSVSDCVMSNPANRGSGGNGYLFEVSRSCEILFKDCIGNNGRHNFIENWDFNTNGCVFLRVKSSGSRTFVSKYDPLGYPAASEFHHSLAIANLIDNSELNDGWYAVNRGAESSGAGESGTENVFWNIYGRGTIKSEQFGRSYIIGTGKNIKVNPDLINSVNKPEGLAFSEGLEHGESLKPVSLFEDQLMRRLKLKQSAPSAIQPFGNGR